VIARQVRQLGIYCITQVCFTEKWNTRTSNRARFPEAFF